jgi:hypothetical protein
MRKKEYKALVETILSLDFNRRDTMSLISELNNTIQLGYDISCITKDGVIILGDHSLKKLFKKKKD